MLREESGGGKKSYPVGSPEWIREQKLLADQRNRQRILDKQKQTAPRPTGHLEPEEIPLPSGDTATRNPVNITPIPRPTGQLEPEPLPKKKTKSSSGTINHPKLELIYPSSEEIASSLHNTIGSPQPGPPPDYIPEPIPTPNPEPTPTPTPNPQPKPTPTTESTPTTTRGGKPVQSPEKIAVEVYISQPWVQKVLNDDSNKEFVYINGDWGIVDKEDSYNQIDLIKQSRNQLWEEEQQAWNSIYDIVAKMGNIIKEKYDQVIFGENNEFSSFQEFMEYVSAVGDIYIGITTNDGYSFSSGFDSLWNLEDGPEFLSDLKQQAGKIQNEWNTIQLYQDFIKHYNNRMSSFHTR